MGDEGRIDVNLTILINVIFYYTDYPLLLSWVAMYFFSEFWMHKLTDPVVVWYRLGSADCPIGCCPTNNEVV